MIAEEHRLCLKAHVQACLVHYFDKLVFYSNSQISII